jgi:hypothetical protein
MPRQMLSVNAYVNAAGVVITSDDHDNVYFQQVATSPQSILIADNSSFINNGPGTYTEIPLTFFADSTDPAGEPVPVSPSIYVTNGTDMNVVNIRHDNWPLRSPGSQYGQRGTFITTFPLSSGSIDEENEPGLIVGSVSYFGTTWGFSRQGGALTLQSPTSTSPYISPLDVFYVDGGQAAFVAVRWTAPPVPVLAASDVPNLTIRYDANPLPPTDIIDEKTGKVIGRDENISLTTDVARAVSAGSTASFTLPVSTEQPGRIIPGTLTGSLLIGGARGVIVPFTVNDSLAVGTVNTLSFGGNASTSFQTIDGGNRTVQGSVDLRTGVVTLNFSGDVPGTVVVRDAKYAVYHRDETPNKVVLAPGLDIQARLSVDLLTSGSEVEINSPLVSVPFLNLRAGSVSFNAVTTCDGTLSIGPSLIDHATYVVGAEADAFVNSAGQVQSIAVRPGFAGQGYDDANPPAVRIIGGGRDGAGNPTSVAIATATVLNGVITEIKVTPGAGYASLPRIEIDPPPSKGGAAPVPQAEQVLFNAPISAEIIDIRVNDDPLTLYRTRSGVVVSPSGSLSGAPSATTVGATIPAKSLYMQVGNGDVLVEGGINVDAQTYLLQSSDQAGSVNAPYLFTTRARESEAATGLITGKSVGITLANDTPTPLEGASLENVVDLDTAVDSLRVTAATASGKAYAGPFPYRLDLRAASDISIDAVASSGSVIGLQSEGSIQFNAALATAAGVEIAANGDFTVSAPISSVRGPISITGSTLTLRNAVSVRDAVEDRTVDDITLTSTAGDLSLTGAVTAINNVRLVQRNQPGATGSISGPSRVVAYGVSVEAEGSATVRTDVVKLDGRSGGDFSIEERNDIEITSLRAPGIVTLFAEGVDPGAGPSASGNTVALKASLADVHSLVASASRGSIDIVSNSSRTLTMGNVPTISAGRATSMQAGGSVSIVSTVGGMAVADAPLSGGGALQVRLATTAPLNAVYAHNRPGIYASTLTAPLDERAALVIGGIAVRVGDRVLVKDQRVDPRQNGIYTVSAVGSPTTRWVLTRARDADTTVEVPAKAFVMASEGAFAGKLFQIGYAPTPSGPAPMSVTPIANRAGAVRVRVATTATLAGTYKNDDRTITGGGSLPLIDGVKLMVGDLVLVKNGAQFEPGLPAGVANGVYVVTSVGGGVGTSWVLTRTVDAAEPITGVVSVAEGSFSAATTGRAFHLGYDSLGNDSMTVVLAGVSGVPATRIGTNNINSTTSFVVSSTAGSNDAAGSLGKMIQLRQSSSIADSVYAKTNFQFSSNLPGFNGAPNGAIRLTQELPILVKPFAIDGSSRYTFPGSVGTAPNVVIDGSRIVKTRVGGAAAAASQVNGFEFRPGAGTLAAKGAGSLAGLTVGGFSKGAAVKLDGARGVLVNKLVLGRNEAGERLANMFGILAANDTAGSTVLNSTIVGSTSAGVRVAKTSSGLSVVGSTIGVDGQNNATGIRVLGGVNRIGVDALASAVKAMTTTGSDQLTLPSAVSPASVYVGQPVTGMGIPAGTQISAVSGSVVTLSQKMTATVNSTVTLGKPARNVVQYNLYGIVLNGGASSVTNTDVANNTFDGIRVGGGAQSIGTSSVLGSNSNAVFGNGGWGVNIVTPAQPSQQAVKGTYFGGPVRATAGAANLLGNVAVNDAIAPEVLGYNPVIPANAVTASDKWGNQYVRPTGKLGNADIKQPWRP